MMDTHELELLDALLTEYSNEVLRIRFVDGDIYDLTLFHVFSETDENGEPAPPEECWANVIVPVRLPEKKMKWFEKAGMAFQLKDVVEVRETTSERLLFPISTVT